MTMILVAAVAVLAVALVIALALLMRGSRVDGSEQFEILSERIDTAADAQSHAYERLERQLRTFSKRWRRNSAV